MSSVTIRSQASAAALLVAASLAWPLFGQVPEPILVVLKNQIGQDLIAARLSALGATGIRRYTAINMLEAEIPTADLDTVKQWPEVDELIPVGKHQALLDQIEQNLTSPPGLAAPIVDGNDEGFMRLIDRIIDDRDALIAAGPSAAALNAIPLTAHSAAQLAVVGTTAHLPVKAMQLNGSDPNYLGGSVSGEQPYRFYVGNAQPSFRSTLAWDRHFSEGLQPALQNLNLSLYNPADGAELAPPTVPSQTVRQAASPEGGDLVIKVRLQPDNSVSPTVEPFALAVSTANFAVAQGPKLAVTCASDCTVANRGDLSAFNVVANANGTEYPLGTIAASSSTTFRPAQPGVAATATSQSFGETFTASTTQDPCDGTWQIANPSVTLDSSNQWTATVAVAPPSACATPWMAWFGPGPVNQIMYVQAPVGFVTGPGSVTVVGTQYPPVPTFTGTLYITKAELATPWAGFSVTNIGGSSGPCTYTVTAVTGNNPSYSGGPLSISIGSQSGCTSSISNDSPSWVVPNGAVTGTANWSAGFNIGPNVQPNQTSSARTANLTVTGSGGFSSKITVQQSGLSCSFTPGTLSLPAAGIPQGTPLSLSLTTNSGCQWTASSTSTFVHLTQAANAVYTNSGSVPYWADANTTGAKRPGYVQIGGGTVAGDQDPQPTNNGLKITNPQAGDSYSVGGRLTVQWSGADKGTHGDINLVDRDGKQLSIQTGVALDTTVSTDWNIALPGTATGAGFKVTIVVGGKVAATSGLFNITPQLSVSRPVAGDVVLLTKNGKPNPLVVNWQYNGPAGINGNFQLIGPDNKSYPLAAAQVLQARNKTLSHAFPTGITPDDGYKIQITPSDSSAAVLGGAFTISSELAIATPSRNPIWTAGSTYSVKITGTGLTVNVYVLPKNGGQRINLKTAEAIPAGGLTFDWSVPATLAAGDYVLHADEITSSGGQTATAPFTVQSKTFTVQGKVIVPTGTEFANLTGCLVTIQQKHPDGSLTRGVTVNCDKGTWSQQLDRVDSSGNTITYQATVARQDYTFTPGLHQFTPDTASQAGASYDFTLRVVAADVAAIGVGGLGQSRAIPDTSLVFVERTSGVQVGTAVLDPNIDTPGNPARWRGTVPDGAIRVSATAPDGTSLRTGAPTFANAPIVAPGVIFVGTAYSTSGTIQIAVSVRLQILAFQQNGEPARAQALHDAAWAALRSVVISFTQDGQASPIHARTADDEPNLIIRWTAYSFTTAHNYRAQAKASAAGYTVQHPDQPIGPKGATIDFVVQPTP